MYSFVHIKYYTCTVLYRRETLRQKVKPVIFYVHGGSFIWGDNKYKDFGPELFMDHDIILVQANYR